jgi:hypothetical protein
VADVLWQWRTVIVLCVLALPAYALVVWARAVAHRHRGIQPRAAWLRGAAEAGAIIGPLPWICMALTPLDGERVVTVVPLRDLAAQIGGDGGFAAAQIGGNLLVFAAIGFFAPMRWPAMCGLTRLFTVGLIGSVTIEALQFSLHLGRVSSIDDVLLNAVGAALGGLASRQWWATRPEPDTPIGDARGGKTSVR